MQKRIDELKKKIGFKYEMFFENSTDYKGCFMPIYFVFPELPKYPLHSADPENNFDYGMANILKHARSIKREDLQQGDFVASKFRNELHVALYIGEGQIIHVFRGHDLRINRLDILKDIKGYFRVIY
jgi:hypothetical protein